MIDDDTTKTDEPTDDAADTADEAAAEPEAVVEADATDEAEEKPEEPAEATEEPKADETAPAAEAAGTDQQGRTLYNVKCSNCGKDTQVPFQPSEGRPVYCRDCYMQKKNA